MSVLMNFAIFPTDKGISVSPYVARVLDVVRAKGFPVQLTSMGTIVETSTLSEALQVIDDAHNALQSDCDRVYITANFDIKQGAVGRMEAKVKSVEDKLR